MLFCLFLEEKIMEYIKRYQSPIGEITMASDGESLIGLWFEDDKILCGYPKGTSRTGFTSI